MKFKIQEFGNLLYFKADCFLSLMCLKNLVNYSIIFII